MTERVTQFIEIKVRNPAAYTLHTVVSSPRTCTPTDIRIASNNIETSSVGGDYPFVIGEFVEFLLKDFFALAHRSGLYNRQKPLWESIARLSKAQVTRVSQGLFKKVDLPVLDIVFEDASGAPQIFVSIIEPDKEYREERKLQESFKDFLRRVEQTQKRANTLRGVFFCTFCPIPQSLLMKVFDMTGAKDPVARYESLLPPPHLVPINIVQYSPGDEGEEGDDSVPDPISSDDERNREASPSLENAGEIVDVIEDHAVMHADELNRQKEERKYTFLLVHPDLGARARKDR